MRCVGASLKAAKRSATNLVLLFSSNSSAAVSVFLSNSELLHSAHFLSGKELFFKNQTKPTLLPVLLWSRAPPFRLAGPVPSRVWKSAHHGRMQLIQAQRPHKNGWEGILGIAVARMRDQKGSCSTYFILFYLAKQVGRENLLFNAGAAPHEPFAAGLP